MDEAFKTALDRAKEAVGGNVGLAKLLSDQGHRITSQAVSQWDRVPADRVLSVESVTGVSRHDLRPDIYPVEAREQAQAGGQAA